MQRTFRAERMITRVKEAGQEDLLDPKTLAIILSLDGETGDDQNWQSVIFDRPLVWIPKTDKHEGAYVNIIDCE